jgi:hypothetical protein
MRLNIYLIHFVQDVSDNEINVEHIQLNDLEDRERFLIYHDLV